MEEYVKKYFETLEQLTILQARLEVLRDTISTNKYVSTSSVCAILGWDPIDEEDEE